MIEAVGLSVKGLSLPLGVYHFGHEVHHHTPLSPRSPAGMLWLHGAGSP